MDFKEFNQVMVQNHYHYTVGVQFYLAWIMELAHKAKQIAADTSNPMRQWQLDKANKDQQTVTKHALKLAKFEHDKQFNFFESYAPMLKDSDIAYIVKTQKEIAPYLNNIGVTTKVLA